MAVKRDENGRFVKGNGGGGRPRQPEAFKDAVRENALPALRVIIGIMQDEDAGAADRIKAANIVIERAFGKPQQTVDMSGALSVTAKDEIDRLLRETLDHDG